MKTLTHLNKKIKFFGLTSTQIMLLIVAVLVVFVIKIILGFIALAFAIIGVARVYNSVKKGNPTPIESFFIKNNSYKKVEDKNETLKYL